MPFKQFWDEFKKHSNRCSPEKKMNYKMRMCQFEALSITPMFIKTTFGSRKTSNLKQCTRRWKSGTCGHFPWKAGERGDALTGGKHGARHWRTKTPRQNSAPAIKTRTIKTSRLPVRSSSPQQPRLLPAFRPQLPLFQRFWRFVLPCFWRNKGNPTDQMIEQRPQASSPKKKCASRAPTPPSSERGGEKKKGISAEVTATEQQRRTCEKLLRGFGGKKCGEDAKGENANSFNFFSPSRVCKWRNWPRRKWDAEYNAQVHWWMGTGAMTTQPARLRQSQVPDPQRVGGSWSVRGGGQEGVGGGGHGQ